MSLITGYRLDQRHAHYREHSDHERHEGKDGRHHAQGRTQFLGAGLGLGDEIVGKGLGQRFQQRLRLDTLAGLAHGIQGANWIPA